MIPDNRCTLVVILISIRIVSTNIKTSLHSFGNNYLLCRSKLICLFKEIAYEVKSGERVLHLNKSRGSPGKNN